MRKATPSFSLLTIAILFIFILSSCNNQAVNVPFPFGDSGYPQPVTLPLKFNAPKKLNWIAIKTGAIKPSVMKFDINALPNTNYDPTGFKPIAKPAETIHFDYSSLPEHPFNLEKKPDNPLGFKTYILDVPLISKAGQISLKYNSPISIYEIGIAQALHEKVILSLLKDKNGIVWIGTQTKIYKYDGENLITVLQKPAAGLIEDRSGKIWFISELGIGAIDTKSGVYGFTDKFNAPFPGLPKMILDHEGNIWITQTDNKGIEIVNPKTETYKELGKEDGFTGRCYGLSEDEKNNIWVATIGGGLNIIDRGAGEIKYLTKSNGIINDTLHAMTRDKKGRIWAAYKHGGILEIDINQGTVTNYGKMQGLEHENTYTLISDNLGQIWMGTRSGLCILDPVRGLIKKFGDIDGTPGDFILDLMMDDKHKMWVGTYSAGILVIDQNAATIHSLPNKTISSLFEDADENIWIGGNGSGITILNRDKGTSKSLDKQHGIADDFIQSFSQFNGNIWITSNGGLDIIDSKNKTLSHTGRKEGLNTDTVYSILKDKYDNVWFTGPSAGIEIMDSAKTNIKLATTKTGLSDNAISAIKEDKNGLIWIATNNKGLDVVDPVTWTIQNLSNVPGLNDTCYKVLLPDKYGRMWVGTDKGIYVIDKNQGTITNISTREGLSNDYISSLLEYKDQVVAAAHEKVNIITAPPYTSDSGKSAAGKWTISFLSKSEGLVLGAQAWDVNAMTKKGKYLWGGTGVTTIEEIRETVDSTPTFITGLMIMNQNMSFANPSMYAKHDTIRTVDSFYVKGQVPAHSPYQQQGDFTWDSVSEQYGIPVNLKIPYNQNYIQFQFAQAHTGREDSVLYSYILEGIDKRWSAISNKTTTDNYLNLPPGDYVFKVCSRDLGGHWGKPAVFSFTITPPWWKTWWAYAICILSLVGLLWWFIHYRSKKLLDENRLLEDKISERTREVKQQADELSTVNQISQALVSQEDLQSLIHLVGNKLRDLFKANIVYVALLDKKTRIISFPYQYGDKMPPLKLGEGLTSKIILSGEPLLINKDVHEHTALLGIDRVGIPASSYLGVPIPVSDEIIGVLSIQSTEDENRFAEKDKRLLSTIAANVGVAIRKARLFEEVKQANTEADAARKTAEEANAAKSAFLSTVSHELRTPLTSVLGFAKITKKRLEEKIFPLTDTSDPKTIKTIEQISGNLGVVIAEGERLTNLINDVLDLAKIEAGKMEWNMEPVRIQDVVDRAIASTSALFDQKNLKLDKKIDENLPEISGDRDKLIQVVVNLLSNAVKFTNQGAVTCSVYQKDGSIVVGITDTGIGIAPEDHDKVFEQFKQVGDTLTDKPKGTGLGLPICKEIVEHHNGHIWLESELGHGSTFYFMLPVIPKDENTVRHIQLNDLVRQLKKRMEQSGPAMQVENATILVVDDDDGIRSLLKQELTEAGYNVDEAINGKDAIVKIRSKRPDLIILDVMMPEMNGFDVAAILKNDPQTMEIPIIILSIVQDKSRGFRIGVDRYLTKPIDTGLLFSEIGHLLEQGKSRKKVMVVDEDSVTVRTLTDVLEAKGYQVVESDGNELVEKAIANQPDIIILNSVISDKHEIVKTLRFEKGLENVLFLIYQ